MQKGAAGVVGHLFLGEDTAPDLRGQGRDRFQKLEGFVQGIPGLVILVPFSVPAELARRLQEGHDL